MQIKKKQVEPDMEQWTGSKLGKEYKMAIFWHPVYLNVYVECVMPNAGLDDSQIYRWYQLTAECEKELKNLLKMVKEESEKAGLKLSIHETMIMASSPITSC